MAERGGIPMTAPARVAVLASGGGSNLGALLDHADRLGDRRAFDVVLVGSNRPAAGALARAETRGMETARIAADDDGAALIDLLTAHAIDLVVLAGYLRLVPSIVTTAYRGRLLNVHPALLPAFGGSGMFGARVHRAVIDAGVRVTGATVHFVDDQYDRGPIIAQWPVPVMPGDTADTLAARVLRAEHAILPPVVDAVAGGRLWLTDDGHVEGFSTRGGAEAAGFSFAAGGAGPVDGLDALLPPSDGRRG